MIHKHSQFHNLGGLSRFRIPLKSASEQVGRALSELTTICSRSRSQVENWLLVVQLTIYISQPSEPRCTGREEGALPSWKIQRIDTGFPRKEANVGGWERDDSAIASNSE